MRHVTSSLPAVFASLSIVLSGFAGAAAAGYYLLPKPENLAKGLLVDSTSVPEGVSVRDFVTKRSKELESEQIELKMPSDAPSIKLNRGQLGWKIDIDETVRRAMRIGHEGAIETRLDEALRARRGQLSIPLVIRFDFTPIIERISPIKEELDHPAVPARFNFATRAVIPHKDGIYLDAFGCAEQVDRAFRVGETSVRVPERSIPPMASAGFLEHLDISQTVGHFETTFGYQGSQANRSRNIENASKRLDGVVLMPLQVLSFNEVVGHRTLENGFHKAWEIFKGEMVEGVGGGTCQVASTLHAAAYLSGFDVLERSPHSRPSAYITMGLDSTVVDGQVDLKLRNPFDFPVVVHSKWEPGRLTFEILGKERPYTVTFSREVLKTRAYKRKVTESAYLPPGKVVRKQKGVMGYWIRRTRTIIPRNGVTRQELSYETYPPTFELFMVPPGTDLETLPPLPGDDPNGPKDMVQERAEAPEIVDGPAVHRNESTQPATLIINR